METTMDSDYDSPIDEVEPTEEIFSGFSPERENLQTEIETYITRLESNIEKMKNLFYKETEIVPEYFKPEPETLVAEEEPKPMETEIGPEEVVAPKLESQVVELDIKPTEEEASVDVNVPQEVIKSEPSPAAGYMLPFFKGWRREVNLKEKEICYIHPFGARLKNIYDVSQQLTDGLTVDNFTFELRALGANPEFEIVTHTVRKSGRVPIPSSNYKIAERLEEESRKRGVENGPVAPIKQGKLVLKLKSRRPENRENGEKGHKKKSSLSRKSAHFQRNWIAEKVEEEPRRNCTLKCPMAMGLIPSLQCCVCLCLYHPECAEVGRTGSTKQIHAYVCKSCRAKPENRKPAEPVAAPSTTQRAPVAPVLPQPPPVSAIAPSLSIPPQHIITLNRRRFVMVPNFLPTSPVAPALTQNPAADLIVNSTTAGPSMKPEVVKKFSEKNTVIQLNLASLVCYGYTALLQVFKQLSVNELGRVAQVCVLYRDLAQHPSLWENVKLNKNVTDWDAFSDVLIKRRTRSLDLRDVVLPPDEQLATLLRVNCLEKIYLPQISLEFLRLLLNSESNLRICYAEVTESVSDEGLIISARRLENLNIRHQNIQTPMPLKSLDIGSCASNLVSLSLLSFTNWQSMDLSSLKQLTKLKILEFGDCAMIPVTFCEVLAALTELISIRLEVGGSTCPMVEILETLKTLPYLVQLELIHFDCPPGFENALADMKNLQRLLIIPLFEFQMAAKVNAVLSAVYKLKDNLIELCWVFLIELLQVSELFITRVPIRRGGGLDSCVPVMLPLPLPEDTSEHAAFWSEISELESSNNYTPVTLAQIQSMCSNALTKTKTQLVVLPKAATIRMSLEELLL